MIPAISIIAMGLFTGCELAGDDGSDEDIAFNNFAASVNLTPSSTAISDWSISHPDGIDSISLTLKDSDSKIVADEILDTKQMSPIAFGDIFGAETSDCDGTYELSLIAYAGEVQGTKIVNITLSGATDCSPPQPDLTTENVVLGAQGNATYPSSYDIETSTTYFAAAAKENAVKIDIVYAHSFVDDEKLADAIWAKAELSFASSWQNANPTYMHKVANGSFDAVTTTDEIEALWDVVKGQATNVAIKAGDEVIVKTHEGLYALIKVVSITAGETGTVTLKVKKGSVKK